MSRAEEVERVGRHPLHDSVGAVAELEPVDRHLRPLVAAENAPRLEAEKPVRAALVARWPQAQDGRCPHGGLRW